MPLRPRSLRTALAAILASASLQAGLPLSGGQIRLDVPNQDLGNSLDHRPGYGLAFQVPFQLSANSYFRTSLSYDIYGHAADSDCHCTHAKTVGLGVDQMFPFGPGQQFYGFVGAYGQYWSVRRSTDGSVPDLESTKLGFRLGLGYRYRRFISFEAGQFTSQADRGYRAGSIYLSTSFLF
jgi:hypothetical protein